MIFKIDDEGYMSTVNEDLELDCSEDCDECEDDVIPIDILFGMEECEEDYQRIMEEGKIGPWVRTDSGENATLYAFTDEQINDLEISREYLIFLIHNLCDIIGALSENFNEIQRVPECTKILVHGDATIVFWDDGSKTVVNRYKDDEYSAYAAFTAALGKKIYGGNAGLREIINSKTVYRKVKEKKAHVDVQPEEIKEGECWLPEAEYISEEVIDART